MIVELQSQEVKNLKNRLDGDEHRDYSRSSELKREVIFFQSSALEIPLFSFSPFLHLQFKRSPLCFLIMLTLQHFLASKSLDVPAFDDFSHLAILSGLAWVGRLESWKE